MNNDLCLLLTVTLQNHCEAVSKGPHSYLLIRAEPRILVFHNFLILPTRGRGELQIEVRNTAQICIIFAHGRDTSRDKTRHSPGLCLCVPQTLRTVSRQVQRSSEVCWISINFSEPLTLKILLDEITLETYDRPGSKKYFAKLFIGLCS